MIILQGEDSVLEAGKRGPANAVAIRAAAIEAVGRLWANVFAPCKGSAPRVIMVSSAEPGAGVTQVTAALALLGSSSRYARRIALVDSAPSPGLADVFRARPAPGIAEVLAGSAPLSAALLRVSDTLDLLPPGRLAATPKGCADGAALAGDHDLDEEKLAGVLRELLSEHDHVLIDAPPPARSSVAEALAGLADGVLLVMGAGVTCREAMLEARGRIEAAGGKVLGLVLNGCERVPRRGFLSHWG